MFAVRCCSEGRAPLARSRSTFTNSESVTKKKSFQINITLRCGRTVGVDFNLFDVMCGAGRMRRAAAATLWMPFLCVYVF